jgi:hypothetical protein
MSKTDETPIAAARPAEAEPSITFDILKKSTDEQRLVFGIASYSARPDGTLITDCQGDQIEPEELEKAFHAYALDSRQGDVQHNRDGSAADLVELFVATPQKLAALMKGLGCDADVSGYKGAACWVGFHVNDDAAWAGVKAGKYRGFSIDAVAQRVEIAKGDAPGHEFRGNQYSVGGTGGDSADGGGESGAEEYGLSEADHSAWEKVSRQENPAVYEAWDKAQAKTSAAYSRMSAARDKWKALPTPKTAADKQAENRAAEEFLSARQTHGAAVDEENVAASALPQEPTPSEWNRMRDATSGETSTQGSLFKGRRRWPQGSRT